MTDQDRIKYVNVIFELIDEIKDMNDEILEMYKFDISVRSAYRLQIKSIRSDWKKKYDSIKDQRDNRSDRLGLAMKTLKELGVEIDGGRLRKWKETMEKRKRLSDIEIGDIELSSWY